MAATETRASLPDTRQAATVTCPTDETGPDFATQCSAADFAGHFGAAPTETCVSLPDTRQAATVTCCTEPADGPDRATQRTSRDFA